MSTPAQHKAEHEAGREALRRAMLSGVAAEVLRAGDYELRKKFKTVVATNLVQGDDEGRTWTVVVTMQAGDGKLYETSGTLKGFPTDDLIASLMLLNASN